MRQSRASGISLALLCGLVLSACGFQPVHRYDDNAAPLLASVSHNGGEMAQLAARALSQRVGVRPDATWDATLSMSSVRNDSQLDNTGTARRTQIRYQLQVTLTHKQTGARQSGQFSDTQSMNVMDSAADEWAVQRNLTALAISQLADSAASFVRQQAQDKASGTAR